MCGMGGSGLGARVIESVFADQLKHPFIRINDYGLPNFVNENTLVFCSSYSGTTEEVIDNAQQAVAKKARWIAIGAGNKLIGLAKENNVPFYKINPRHNPSNQPRMAIGYSVIGQLVLAAKAGLFKFTLQDIDSLVKTMSQVQEKNKVEIDSDKNPAKKLAAKLKGKSIFYIAARHLVGAMHTVNNQLNENAKTFSADFQIPELNHHLMEGLKHPKTNPEHLFFVFANSSLYPDRVQKRMAITRDVVSKNNVENYEYRATSKSKLTQAFELIQFGGFVNLYLSVLYGQNPAPIPWVDYFKKKLGQPLGK
jgi:glucose/mannose-6-phosphate isomerase